MLAVAEFDRVVSGYRRSEEATVESEEAQRARRHLAHHREDDGSVTIRVRLTAADAATVLAAVDARVGPAKDDDGRLIPLDVRRADALVDAVVGGGAAGELVHVHVDAEVLAGGHGRCDIESAGDTGMGPAPMSAEAVRRLLCDRPYVTVEHGPDGEVVAVSARRRLVRGVQRRLVEQRDQGCRVPGCERRGRIEVHHLVHRADGGSNESNNLVCVCRYHHHRIHDGGWQLVSTGDGFELVAPDGRRVPARPPSFTGDRAAVDDDGRVTTDGRSTSAGDPLHLGLVTELLHHAHSPGSAPKAA